MVWRHHGMIEIVRRLVRHPQLFHDSPGGLVLVGGESHPFAQPEFAEGHGQHRPGPLCRQPLAPMGPGQAPAHFHARGEMSLDRGLVKSDEANARCNVCFRQPCLTQ